jgi:Na+/proline symporter
VWTDTLQSILMFASMFAILVFGLKKVGGWEEVWKRNEQGGRLELFEYLFQAENLFETIIKCQF